MKTGISMVELNHNRKVKADNQRKLIKEYEAKIINQRETIKGLQNKNKWISVGDKLKPEKNKWLLWFDGNETMEDNEGLRHHVDIINDRGECLINYVHNYTHWMPLPKPPEGI